jgi:hypothetical protein
VASVCAKHYLDAQLISRFREAASLISQLARQYQQPLLRWHLGLHFLHESCAAGILFAGTPLPYSQISISL